METVLNHKCRRCSGLLVPTAPLVYAQSGEQLQVEDIEMTAIHCVNCGAYFDEVILRNQRTPIPVVRLRQRVTIPQSRKDREEAA